jgi:hypothetical protein
MSLAACAKRELTQAIRYFEKFTLYLLHITMRPYQREAANAIIADVQHRRGNSFVIIFSRQSGKDEMLANLFLYLMLKMNDMNASIVCAQPTFKPQTINAMNRLRHRGTQFGKHLKRSDGFIFTFQTVALSYFSADPSANVVGATASRLLVINEAQDVEMGIYDKRFSPMAASGNATRVFSGTSWTSNTLLERERQAALMAEQKDGIKRVFMADASEVSKSNKWYGKFVKSEIEKLGRQHPLIKTQFFNELIDSNSGMFPARRLALMLPDQPPQSEPIPGHLYALTVDVGGQDEALMNLDGMGNPGRDYVTADLLDVDLSSLDTLQAPVYRCVKRSAWQGENHVTIFGALCALIDAWNIQHIVVDSTGVGEGLWGMLFKKYPTRVIPVKFSSQVKSEIGYAFIAMLETGRFRDCARTPEIEMQYEKCQSEILIGPSKTMRWGVKDGTRGPDGQLVHDDYVIADALTTRLDELEWSVKFVPFIISYPDPLIEMSKIK